MEQQELYPELVDYIYDNYGKFITDDELTAAAVLHTLPGGVNPQQLMFAKKSIKSEHTEVVKNMIASGINALKVTAVARIWQEHRSELSLNLCLSCGKIARTPLAKQCRFCLHDWH